MRSKVITLTAAATLSFGLSQALAQSQWAERDRWGRQAFGALDTNHDGRLEGQRELETADAGYTPSLGSRAEYSDGYRAGFRQAYAEGFGPRT